MNTKNVGAKNFSPENIATENNITNNIVGAKNFSPENIASENNTTNDNARAKDFSPLRGTSRTIGSIIRGVKIGVTKQMGYPIWQRSFYDHIIRDEQSYQNIANYIVNNPANWGSDKFYI
jgi:hypothetical protein